MEKRCDKLTGKSVSLLGYGTMRMPYLNGNEDEIDYPQAENLIDYAYSHGVNYFDTAYPYHKGKSELFVGHALHKYPRESFFLADKMPPWALKSEEDVARIFEEQLQKCQVEYFDFYLCHAVSEESLKKFQEFNVISYLDKQKKAGRIRHLGFSFHDSAAVLEKVVALYSWDFAQIQLNYLDWEMQDSKGQYDILDKNNIACIVMEPVRGGTLATLSDESAAVLKAVEPENSVASWAIRYAATLPNVLTVLSGMSTLKQVEDNVKTMTPFHPLTQADYASVDHALEVYKKNVTIPCTGCRYCMDCPAGVDIPAVFKIYNHYAIGKDRQDFKNDYAALGEIKQPQSCVSCGQCVTHCPQGISIPERLAEIKAKMDELTK